ncbi:MAG: PHP domain-containing protein [candidate division WOR-3 bacterium]|nr:PHP domain-containing protein [candidate division WOR-3 bacterium]MCX7836671.1 PHP domain-containing protein [candidate division WOR-3 bacterium]
MEDSRYCDLHIHTIFSDGLYSPEEVVRKAKELGFSAIGIADHDAVAGIEEAMKIGEKLGIEIIPACEFSCVMEDKDIHILGYLLDYKNSTLKSFLKKVQDKRIERAEKIIGNLSKQGIKIELKRVLEIAKNGTVGRPHIAQALLEEGYVSNIEEAFMKFIGYHCPAYVPKMEISPNEALQLIKDFKGIPVLAHPISYDFEKIIFPLIKMGILGIEVYHPEHTEYHIHYFLEIAKKYNLLITGGSDCHGGRKGKLFLGEIKLPYFYLEDLKEKRRQLFLDI